MTVTLHLGDCLDVMRGMESASVDAVITDPPYGVGFQYDGGYDDAREDYSRWILKCLSEMRRISRIVVITPGITHLFDYPRPLWTMCYFKPGSTRRNGTGGFNEWEPILIYADKLNLITDAKRFPDCVNHSKGNDHPCPKPLNAFIWFVNMASNEGQTILDPFMGSGTTGVACAKLNRNFIGIEINPTYFEIAQRRIAEAQAQLTLPMSV